MFNILAQFTGLGVGWGIGHILIVIILIAAGIAITFLVLKKLGITIPDWVIQIFWICCVATFGILAIKFLFSL